jgi:signal peptide peptidase SppA
MNKPLGEQLASKLDGITLAPSVSDGLLFDHPPVLELTSIPVVNKGERGHSLIKYLTSSEWAIMPEKLEQFEAVLNQYLSGTNIKLDYSTDEATRIMGKVAVVPITGTVVKRAYGLASLSGVRGTVDIQNSIQEALDNPAISGIVLRIDSPGGTVDGTKELADYIARAKSKKPIVAYADGLMASAAYWIGSAATEIVAFDTAKLGSIGVVVSHQDRSEQEKRSGVKTTYIYQGKYKTAGNSSEPLTAEGKAYIQAHIDTYYSMFVDAVAQNRSIERDTVIKDVALGSVFIGQNAVDLNLADSIGNLDDAILLAHKLGEEKMNLEEMQARVEEQEAIIATLTSQLETEAQTSAALLSQVEQLSETLAQRDQEEATAKRHAEVATMFAGLNVSDEFIASIVDLDPKIVTQMHKELSARQTTLDSQLSEFTVQTEGATSEGGDVTSPTTIDEAVNMIEHRDNCDVEEATDKAQAEFPKLFENQ